MNLIQSAGGLLVHPQLPGHLGGGPAGGDDVVGGLPPVLVSVLVARICHFLTFLSVSLKLKRFRLNLTAPCPK